MAPGRESQTSDERSDASEPFDTAVAASSVAVPAGMFRRTAALLYDSLGLVAVLMLATVPFLPFLNGKVLQPEEVGALAYVYRAWQVIVIAAFFGFFWTWRGQTLGMQAWRLRVEAENGRSLTWRTALLRQAYGVLPWLPGFLVLSQAQSTQRPVLHIVGSALLLLGVAAWTAMWFDPRRRTWHDRQSRSRVVLLPLKRVPDAW